MVAHSNVTAWETELEPSSKKMNARVKTFLFKSILHHRRPKGVQVHRFEAALR